MRHALVVASFVIAGCTTVGPDFSAPATPAPVAWADWHGGDASLAPPADAPALPAWSPVIDAPLRTLLAQADAANADLQAAALHVAQARTQLAVVSSQGLPQVNASASAQREALSANGTATRILEVLPLVNRQDVIDFIASPFNVYDAGFDAAWELDLWGRVRRGVEAADAGTQQQRALLAQARIAVHAEVARTYHQLRGVQAQLRAARDELAAAREAETLTAARVRNGLAPDSDAVQQHGMVADLQSRIPPLLQQEVALTDALTLLAGERPGALAAALAPQEGTLRFDAPPVVLGLPSEFAARRPDVQAALAQLHVSTTGIGVAEADLYPRIALTGSFGFESLKTGELADFASRQWHIGPSLSLPIFDAGRRRGNVELRKLEQQEAAVRFQQTVLRAWHDVDGAVSQYNAERARGEQLQVRVDAARDALQLARGRWRNGLTMYAPVLDAQRVLAQAESAWADHDARLAAAWIALLKALAVDVPAS